eukprot:2536459-Amphidinium_carterae.1
MMIHSVNIQQQVVLLQAVVQRFEVHGNCDLSQEWIQEIWRSIGEIAGHLHEVARFAVQGFDHQWMQHQALQQEVEQLSTDVKSCLSFAGRLTRNEEATAKQDAKFVANVSILRQKAERTQSRFEKVIGLLDGIDVPVREAFSQIYAEREGIDNMTARLVQLEDNGAVASDNDMCLAMDARISGVVQAIWNDRDLDQVRPTLSDRFSRLLDEKIAAQHHLITALDTRKHTLTQELEKLGSKLLDRQEEVAGEQRREFIKFRSEIQATSVVQPAGEWH